MKVILPGGNGHIGQALQRHFAARGDSVVVLSRSPKAPNERAWDGRTLGDWASEVDGADVVINLAGRTVNCRYTPENLKQMMDSRTESTKVIGEAIQRAANPPKLWLNSSTATIYAHRFDAPNDEFTGIIGGSEPDVPRYWDYSIEIAKRWEEVFFAAETQTTRRIAMRSAMVMSPIPGSVFAELAHLAKLGLMGKLGSGTQFVSWIHETDFLHSIDFLIEREDISGVVNLASPLPLPNVLFNQILRKAVGARFGFPASEWMLKIGAALMKTDVELLLKSRRVIPTRLLQAGFTFQFPTWEQAAQDLAASLSPRQA